MTTIDKTNPGLIVSKDRRSDKAVAVWCWRDGDTLQPWVADKIGGCEPLYSIRGGEVFFRDHALPKLEFQSLGAFVTSAAAMARWSKLIGDGAIAPCAREGEIDERFRDGWRSDEEGVGALFACMAYQAVTGLPGEFDPEGHPVVGCPHKPRRAAAAAGNELRFGDLTVPPDDGKGS